MTMKNLAIPMPIDVRDWNARARFYGLHGSRIDWHVA
jgi:hypothetical protein